MAVFFGGVAANNLDMGPFRDFIRNVAGATMMGWVTYDALGTSRALIGLFGAVGGTRAKISTLTSNVVELRGRSLDTDASSTIATTATLAVNQRYHIAGVFDFSSKSGLIYINGDLSVAGTFANMTAGNTSDTACETGTIGANESGTNNAWLGHMEDVRIYTRVLGDNEIKTIYASRGCDNIHFGIQARWVLDEQGPGVAVSTVPDVSGNGFGINVSGTLLYSAGTLKTNRGPSRAGRAGG